MKQVITLLFILSANGILFGQADANFKKGMVKYSAKDYKGAIADFTKSIAANPKNATTYICRANCKKRLEDYKGAVDDYTKAIQLKPNNSEAYTSRAHAKFILLNYGGTNDEYKAIVADYKKAIE